ncbi:MAG TPA: hypothetical protein PK323_06240 [Bacteroidia bacterium]|nr:hypothetical protein [Bacteroidia bacterium]
MNKSNKIVALGITITTMIFASCGGNKEAETAPSDTAKAETAAAPESTVDEMVDFKFHYLTANIPSPMELVDALPKAGIPFSKDVLNNTENESKYNTSLQKAINFGIYSVDMAYLTTNEEFPMVKSYLNTSRNLAKSLDLSETFDKVVGNRLSQNSENKDSLKKVIDEAYYEVDNYMRNNERALAATQMLTGSWIESQYITLTLIKDVVKDEKNAMLFDKVFEQKRHLASLVSLLKEYEKEKAFKPIIDQVYELNNQYSAMKNEDVTNKEFLNKMAASIAKIRNGLVK